MTENIPAISHQHGFKHKHSTHTALQNICHQITTSFNNPRPPQCTVAVTLDMSKAFDAANIHKLTLANIPNIIINFKANYIKGQAFTQYNDTLSKLKRINTGVPQSGVLSPTLFNIYTSDIPLPPKDVQITTYADDITITTSHTKHHKIKQIIQPYLCKIYKWAITNNLHINSDKTTTTLLTPDTAKYSITLSLKLNNQTLPTTKHPKILGTTLDPKLTFSQHISVTITKVKQTLNIPKALCSVPKNRPNYVDSQSHKKSL